MGSAKTALLLTQAYNFEERNMQYLCMKPIIDNRESANVIRSRIGIERACSWIYPEMDRLPNTSKANLNARLKLRRGCLWMRRNSFPKHKLTSWLA